MKSFQVLRDRHIPVEAKELYSNLLVLHSQAGYYIGTLFTSPIYGTSPGTRDTSYVQTESQAQLALQVLTQMAKDMEGQLAERIIDNWEATMRARHNLKIWYRWHP